MSKALRGQIAVHLYKEMIIRIPFFAEVTGRMLTQVRHYDMATVLVIHGIEVVLVFEISNIFTKGYDHRAGI